MNIDDRLRAASRALKDSSLAQVDAATPLQEIVRHTGQPVAHARTTVLPDPLDQPQEPPGPLAPSSPWAARWRRIPQRLALAVSLLLVLALGIVIGIAASSGQDTANPASPPEASTASPPEASTAASPEASTAAAPPEANTAAPPEANTSTAPPAASTQVPEACLDTAKLPTRSSPG